MHHHTQLVFNFKCIPFLVNPQVFLIFLPWLDFTIILLSTAISIQQKPCQRTSVGYLEISSVSLISLSQVSSASHEVSGREGSVNKWFAKVISSGAFVSVWNPMSTLFSVRLSVSTPVFWTHNKITHQVLLTVFQDFLSQQLQIFSNTFHKLVLSLLNFLISLEGRKIYLTNCFRTLW